MNGQTNQHKHNVQIKSLKVFCDVVRLRSFSRAADENEISQSAASQMVHHLEERLNVKLIDRSKRPFILTSEGEAYYEGCRGLVDKYLALEDRIRSLQGQVAGRVRVASIYSVGLHHMAAYLKTFLGRYPKANVRLEYLHPQRVYRSIENDTSDLGLVSYPKESRRVKVIPWRSEPMVLVCAPRHPLGQLEQADLQDLQGVSMVGFVDGLTIRREIDKALAAQRVEAEMAMEFDNIETIKRAIEIDAGVALLPEPTVLREVAAGSLCAIPLIGQPLNRPLGIIHRRGKEMSSTARRFIDLLRSDPEPAEGQASSAGVSSGSQQSDSTQQAKMEDLDQNRRPVRLTQLAQPSGDRPGELSAEVNKPRPHQGLAFGSDCLDTHSDVTHSDVTQTVVSQTEGTPVERTSAEPALGEQARGTSPEPFGSTEDRTAGHVAGEVGLAKPLSRQDLSGEDSSEHESPSGHEDSPSQEGASSGEECSLEVKQLRLLPGDPELAAHAVGPATENLSDQVPED